MRIFIFISFILIVGFNCNNSEKQTKLENDCFQSIVPKETYFYRKPYISIDSTIKTITGCKYIATTQIFLDSVAAWQINLRKCGNKIYIKTILPESKEFVFFDFEIPLNKKRSIQIHYQDSLLQTFESVLESKLQLKDNSTVYLFRVYDFYYYEHNVGEFSSPFDVMFFITEENGIIGSYLTDDTKLIVSPAGNILTEYIDYSDYTNCKLL